MIAKRKHRLAAITPEQQAHRDSIIKRKKRAKPAIKANEPVPISKYMENCVWWINEYLEGRQPKKRAIDAAGVLMGHCEAFIAGER